MLGPVLKVVLALLLPVAFVLLLVFGISGSVLVSLGYGFFTPLVATFEAVREGRENKFHHCFMVCNLDVTYIMVICSNII